MQVQPEKPPQPEQVPVAAQTTSDNTASDTQVLFSG